MRDRRSWRQCANRSASYRGRERLTPLPLLYPRGTPVGFGPDAFGSLDELNDQLVRWIGDVAHTRALLAICATASSGTRPNCSIRQTVSAGI